MPKREPELPAAQEIERLLLGSVVLNHDRLASIEAMLSADDFLSEANRRIFRCMKAMRARGEKIDRLTLPNALGADLSLVGGFKYLTDLDNGLPDLPNLDSYIGILKEKSALRRVIYLSQQASTRALAGDGSSSQIIGDLVGEAQRVEQDSAAWDKVPSMESLINTLTPNEILSPTARNAVKTGFKGFDNLTTGFEYKTLSVIAGRTSAGKSAIALNMAMNMIARGIPVAYFSMEMSAQSLIHRMICTMARVNMTDFRLGNLTASERQVLQQTLSAVYDQPLYIDEARQPVRDIDRKLERLVGHKGVKVAIIDYIQLMKQVQRGHGSRNTSTAELLGEIVEALRAMAKRLDIAMVVLAQLSREHERRSTGEGRPILSDLRDSGEIENCADLVTFVYRGILHKPERFDLKDRADLIVAKQRQGALGTIPMKFTGRYTLFEDL